MLPKRPDISFLSEFASQNVWQLAFDQAERGSLNRHNVGAVIFDERSGRVLSHGCSRFPDHAPQGAPLMPGIHAEMQALDRVSAYTNLTDACVVTVAIAAKNGNHCTSSQPCGQCLSALAARGVSHTIFIERDAEYNWQVHRLHIPTRYAEVRKHITYHQYGRMMRLPRLTAC